MGVASFERSISASHRQNQTQLDHTPSKQKQLPILRL